MSELALALRSVSDSTFKTTAEPKPKGYPPASVLKKQREKLERELTWLKSETEFKKRRAQQLYDDVQINEQAIILNKKWLFNVIAAQEYGYNRQDAEVSERDGGESKKKKRLPLCLPRPKALSY